MWETWHIRAELVMRRRQLMIVCNGEFEALVGQLTCEVTAGDWVEQLPQVEADALASFGDAFTLCGAVSSTTGR